jgi:hypothetical protein
VFLRHSNVKASVIALLVGGLVSLPPRVALADVSTWLGVAAGVSLVDRFDFESPAPTMRLGTGMGTDPSHPWIVGGMLRADTLFGHGTDLSLMLRLANHGYVNGGWGFAIDAGPLARFWGADAFGGAAVATVGGPWGLEAGITASYGDEHVRSLGCFLGIDLARLTVYRRSGSSWWKNSFPAYRTPAEEAH